VRQYEQRLAQDVVLHHEVYDASGEPAHRAAYDGLMGAFKAWIAGLRPPRRGEVDEQL